MSTVSTQELTKVTEGLHLAFNNLGKDYTALKDTLDTLAQLIGSKSGASNTYNTVYEAINAALTRTVSSSDTSTSGVTEERVRTLSQEVAQSLITALVDGADSNYNTVGKLATKLKANETALSQLQNQVQQIVSQGTASSGSTSTTNGNDARVGDLQQLQTAAKATVINAINEIVTRLATVEQKVGDLEAKARQLDTRLTQVEQTASADTNDYLAMYLARRGDALNYTPTSSPAA